MSIQQITFLFISHAMFLLVGIKFGVEIGRLSELCRQTKEENQPEEP